jgi:hypothetical protein
VNGRGWNAMFCDSGVVLAARYRRVNVVSSVLLLGSTIFRIVGYTVVKCHGTSLSLVFECVTSQVQLVLPPESFNPNPYKSPCSGVQGNKQRATTNCFSVTCHIMHIQRMIPIQLLSKRSQRTYRMSPRFLPTLNSPP